MSVGEVVDMEMVTTRDLKVLAKACCLRLSAMFDKVGHLKHVGKVKHILNNSMHIVWTGNKQTEARCLTLPNVPDLLNSHLNLTNFIYITIIDPYNWNVRYFNMNYYVAENAIRLSKFPRNHQTSYTKMIQTTLFDTEIKNVGCSISPNPMTL